MSHIGWIKLFELYTWTWTIFSHELAFGWSYVQVHETPQGQKGHTRVMSTCSAFLKGNPSLNAASSIWMTVKPTFSRSSTVHIFLNGQNQSDNRFQIHEPRYAFQEFSEYKQEMSCMFWTEATQLLSEVLNHAVPLDFKSYSKWGLHHCFDCWSIWYRLVLHNYSIFLSTR